MENKKEIQFNDDELQYLIMIIEQNIEDYQNEFGELHKETLENIYNKLNK